MPVRKPIATPLGPELSVLAARRPASGHRGDTGEVMLTALRVLDERRHAFEARRGLTP